MMTYRAIRPVLLLSCVLAMAAVPLWAQAPGDSVVTGMGSVTIEKRPELLRLSIMVQADGPTLKEALAKLKTRREDIKKGIAKLGAVAESIEFGDAMPYTPGGSRNEREAMMRRLMAERLSSKPASTAPSTSVTVACSFKADWKLEGATTEDTLVAAADLQEKIKKAKVFELPKSPQKQEEEEEAVDSSDGSKPGEPEFSYVAKISDEEQARAASEAFTKAKAAAAKLAKAAGSELGALRHLSNAVSDLSSRRYYDYDRYGPYLQGRGGGDAADGSTESVSPQAGKVTWQMVVNASFSLGAAK